MNSRTKDLLGCKFGRLTVIALTDKKIKRHSVWVVRCECGTEKELSSKALLSTRSCGCSRIEKIKSHGCSYHPLYNVWRNMLSRCNDKKANNYHNYGGRGILVCDRWKVLENFIHDMESSYKPGLTIERIDNSKGYEPSNCEWSTRKKQANNRRSNRIIEYEGKSLSLSEWSVIIGKSVDTIRKRINKGWALERVLSTSKQTRWRNT